MENIDSNDISLLLESKLQKLQLSQELEMALEQELGRIEGDPLLSSKFDVNEYINQHFSDGNSFHLNLKTHHSTISSPQSWASISRS